MFGDAYGIHGVPIGDDGLPVWVDWSIVPGVLSPALDQGRLELHFKLHFCRNLLHLFECHSHGKCLNFLKTGQYVVLSPQQIIDCNILGLGDPLKGGNAVTVLKFAIQNGGILPESAYPFTGVKGPCKSNKGPLVTIDSWQYVKPNCELSMKYATAHQPVIVDVHLGDNILVDDTEMAFWNYEEMDPKFLRNLKYSRKHNKKGGEEVQD
ncbi:hypothetical protein ACQ4PT_060947 [Festuca glaucescens]